MLSGRRTTSASHALPPGRRATRGTAAIAARPVRAFDPAARRAATPPRASVDATAARGDASEPPLRLTRLQREAQALLAIDVEYVHVCTAACPDERSGAPIPGERLQLAAEVCLVDHTGVPVVHTFCNPMAGARPGWRRTSGVPTAEWLAAPPLKAVRERVAALIRGRPLVGHNLGKDLAALGLSHPAALQRDTMRYAALQGSRGHGRALRELAGKKLGRGIQRASRHDPREDAVAALDLYLRYVHYDPALMRYDDLVEHYAAALLGGPAAAP